MNITSDTIVVHGSGANMRQLRDGEADLIITGPPYFPLSIAQDLEKPRAQQVDSERISSTLTSFALSFRPVYKEIARVLKPGGALVVQVRDIRYGEFILPIVSTHWDLMLSAGLSMVTRVYWTQVPGAHSRKPQYLSSPRIGVFKADDVENFLVFSHPCGIEKHEEMVDLDVDPSQLITPLWRLASPHRKSDHPWASPREIVRRFILLYSRPGDLVVDPFMGFGTILEVAHSLGRRAAGWDIDLGCFEAAQERLT